MKIVLSPSKTKTIQGAPTVATFHPEMTERIMSHVRSLSLGELGKALKLKDDKAVLLHEFYQSFDTQPTGAACESYDGIAFKYLDWSSLATDAQVFGDDHLVIMSALYGVVEPRMAVRDYRLDMVDKIGLKLYDEWQEVVTNYFKSQDWILNLASKEYAKMIDHPVIITVEFWELRNGVWKQLSTSSKISRGMMARYCLEHQVTQVCDLPSEINGFSLAADVAELSVPIESMVVRYECVK